MTEPVTDPSLIKELNNLLAEKNTTAVAATTNLPQASQTPEKNTMTNNPLFHFLTGAGGAIQDSLAALPYSPIPKAPPSQGIAGGIGNVAGNIASFLGGGELLESARALSEGLPLIGHLAKSLGGEGLAGIARRITGSSVGGALENPDDRTRGAVKGALLGSVAESIPALGTQLLKVPEKINPRQYTADLADTIRSAYNQTKEQSEANYNAVMNKVGTYPVDHPNLLYPELNKKFMRAYGAGENLLHEDYITKPTVEKAHFLQSQIGHKIRKLQANPDKDPATINAIDDLNTVRRSLLSDLSSALNRVDPSAAKEYYTAGEFHRKNLVPFEQNKIVRDISEGDTKDIQPRTLLKALTKLTQSEKKGVPNEHFLNTAQTDLKKRINQGKLLKDIVTGGTGAAIGMTIHPGLWPAALGLAGGGFFGHYGLPRLLRIAENPEAKLGRLNQPYRLLANSLMANLLPTSQENIT